MGMCCGGKDEGEGVILMLMECSWGVGGVSSVECVSINPDGHWHKSGDVSAVFVPCGVVLKSLYCINVGCNLALLVGQCPVSPNFIVYGGRPVSRCDGDSVDSSV